MTKFSAIPPNSTPGDGDFVVSVSSGNVDQRFTLTNLLTWLKSKLAWLTAKNIDFTTIMLTATGSGAAVTTTNTAYSALAGTPSISFTLANAATVYFMASTFVQGTTTNTTDTFAALYDGATQVSVEATFTSVGANNGGSISIVGSVSFAAGNHTLTLQTRSSSGYAFFPSRSSIVAIKTNV